MKKILVIGAILSLILLIVIQSTNEKEYIVKVGDYSPDFQMELITGDTVKLSEFRGKVIMLQFTASWCGVCRKEMPFIENDIWQKNKNNPDFVLLAIDRDEPLKTVIDFANSIPISYPIGLDPNAEIFSKFAIKESGITRNVIIDKSGKIAMLTRLYDEREFRKMTQLINLLLEN